MGHRAPLRVATRASALARWQAERVVELLGIEAELVLVTTTGDREPATPIHTMGGQGVFAKEVQQAVLDGRADVAVHSAKDLPPRTPDGLVLGAVPERGDVRDVLVGSTRFDALGPGAVVASGSVRRRAQLAALRPDLVFAELRGNIQTRLERAAAFDAAVTAAAALDRLGLSGRIAQRLDPSVLLPQAGQGAIAAECRVDDVDTRAALAAIDDAGIHRRLLAERAFLAELGGGCDLPCGALALDGDRGLELHVMLAAPDGTTVLRVTEHGEDPVRLGTDAARRLLDNGGRALLAAATS